MWFHLECFAVVLLFNEFIELLINLIDILLFFLVITINPIRNEDSQLPQFLGFFNELNHLLISILGLDKMADISSLIDQQVDLVGIIIIKLCNT